MSESVARLLTDPDALASFKREVFDKISVRDRFNRLSPYEPHAHQERLHFEAPTASHRVVAAGRRGGKTLACQAEAIAMAGIPGTVTWIGAPTYALTDRVFKGVYQQLVVEKIYGEAPVRARYSDDKRYIEMPWGSIVEGKSAERPASSKGASLDLFIDDECAEHDEAFYTEYVGPGLGDRRGRAIFISTPLGLTWFHDYFKRGKQTKFKELGWWSHTWRSEDNPYLDSDWLKQQRLMVSDHVWRQEYLAEFLARSGMIWEDYRDEDMESGGHLFDTKEHRIDPAWSHYRSIDIGFNHPTACVWLAVDPDNNIWVYDEYLVQSPLHRDHARAISAQTVHPIVDTFISWEAGKADGKDGPTVLQIYQEAGIFARPAPKAFDLRIASVATYLRSAREDQATHPGLFISHGCPKLRDQIKRYRWKDLKEGQAAGKPTPHRKGVDDDLCDALGMGCVSKPAYAPQWLEETQDPYSDRYGPVGHRGIGFNQRHDDIVGIPGLATLPRIN